MSTPGTDRAAPPGELRSGEPAGSLPAAAAGGLAVALAATGLSGVLSGPRWWPFAIVTIAVVVTVGMLLRGLRLAPPLVAAGQFGALAGLVTAVFTRSGVALVLPGPAAAGEVRDLLVGAAQQIRVGVPPVPESTELLCVAVIALGLIAVAVDTVAVAMAAPAAAGLVLLCVAAVPASLSDRLLPWWSFALGVLGFALLLAVDGQHHHRRWGAPAGSGGGLSGGAGLAVALGAGATAAALLAGTAITAVGTEGRLLGARADSQRALTGIGLNPFTSLRGQLDTGEPVELFRVRGLTEPTYLRALTLSRFAERQGWQQGTLDGATPAGGGLGATGAAGTLPLPTGATDPVPGPRIEVQIEPVDYVDTWLPTFGYPLRLDGLAPQWRYDPDATTVFSDRRRHAEPYTEIGVLPEPDPARLRAAGPAGAAPFRTVDPRYLDAGGVDPRVTALAAQVTAPSATAFDAAVALNRWFTGPQAGFRYDLRTAPGSSGDALVDFLVTGRSGYCEQFASAMAIMLRTLGVPARVAVGFTAGSRTGSDTGERLITTADAHAWVEAWFPGAGWIPFDPTPLADGRTVLPPYLNRAPGPLPDTPVAPDPPDAPAAGPNDPPDAAQPPPAPAGTGPEPGIGTGLLTAGGVLVLLGLTGLGPRALRAGWRATRLRRVHAGGPGAASAAWEEVLAESADRGSPVPADATVRATARWLAAEHGLDEQGRDGLRALVGAVERSWYGPVTDAGPGEAAALVAALDAVRASLHRCAPAPLRARLLPRSVLRPALRPVSRVARRVTAERDEPRRAGDGTT